jgi:hypothetical protein
VNDESVRADAVAFIRRYAPDASGAAVDRTAAMLAASTEPPFHIEPWCEFRDYTPPQVPYVIDGVVPTESTGLLGADAKCGKTWIGLHAAVCVAAGRPFIGRFVVPAPLTVVYVALEGARANLRARIGALARGADVNPDLDADDLDQLHVLYKPLIDLRNPGLTEPLVEELIKVGPGLVVFDVLRKAAHVRESNEGAGDFREVLANTRALTESGCAVLYPHHNTKPNADSGKRQAGERLSGSGALYGHADFGVFITAFDRANRVMTVEFSTRDEAELGEFTVRLTGKGSGRHGGFTYTDRCVVTGEGEHDAADQRQEHTEHKIRQQLRDHGGASQVKIIEAVGGNRDAAIATLGRLVRTNVVYRQKGRRNAWEHWLWDDPERPIPMVLGQVGTGGDSGALSPTCPDPPRRGGRKGQVKSTYPNESGKLDPDSAEHPE